MARAAEILAWHPGNRDCRLTAEHVEAKVTLDNLLRRARRKPKPWPLLRNELIVLSARFGLTGPEHSLEDIAKVIGVSRERVRQIEAKALRRLRKAARLPEPEWQPPPHKLKPKPAPAPVHVIDGQADRWYCIVIDGQADRWYCIAGELTLDCDGCKAKIYSRVFHKGGVVPLALVDHIRQVARAVGWSTDGGDWCPQCVHVPAYHTVREAQHRA